MEISQVITEYNNTDTNGKKQLIDHHLLSLEGKNFEEFLNLIILHREREPAKYSIELIAANPDLALKSAIYLLQASHEDDDLNTLKYYGAQIMEKAGRSLDYRITIPSLIAAYDLNDYRDARYGISRALTSYINEPIELIARVLAERDADVKDELSTNLYSYTTYDIASDVRRIEDEKKRKSKK